MKKAELIFEIINPSDPYTMVAEDGKVAQVACLILGKGKLGLKCEADCKFDVPLMFVATEKQFEEWCENAGIGPLAPFIEKHCKEIADCLDSVLIGDESDRRTMERVLAAIKSPKERARAREVYHDEKRGSVNDIGRAAYELAAVLRKPRKKSA